MSRRFEYVTGTDYKNMDDEWIVNTLLDTFFEVIVVVRLFCNTCG